MDRRHALKALATAAWLGLAGPTGAGGGAVLESRATAAFDRIHLAGPADLVFTVGERHAVVVEAEPALQARIRIRTSGGELHFDYGPGRLQTRHPLRFHVSAPHLAGLTLDGNGDTRVGPLTAHAFSIAARGSGDVTLDAIDTRQLTIDHEGAGDLRVVGHCQRLTLAAADAGELDLSRLSCDQARLRLAGTGDVRTRVRDRLDATLTGSGDLIVIGRPSVTAQSLGIGELRLLSDNSDAP